MLQFLKKRDGLREKVEKHVQEHIELYEKERKARQPTLRALQLLRWAYKADYWVGRMQSWWDG